MVLFTIIILLLLLWYYVIIFIMHGWYQVGSHLYTVTRVTPPALRGAPVLLQGKHTYLPTNYSSW